MSYNERLREEDMSEAPFYEEYNNKDDDASSHHYRAPSPHPPSPPSPSHSQSSPDVRLISIPSGLIDKSSPLSNISRVVAPQRKTITQSGHHRALNLLFLRLALSQTHKQQLQLNFNLHTCPLCHSGIGTHSIPSCA